MAAQRPKRIAVVGGGITGLSATYHLQRLATDASSAATVRLFESSSRLGGQIRTERCGEFVLEAGPDSLVTQKPAGVALCRELGLEDSLQCAAAGSSSLQLVHDGKLHHLPDGFVMMAPTRLGPLLGSRLLSWRGKARIAAERFLPRAADVGDESLRSFVTRRFGAEAFQRLAEPILAGLFTADADELSLEMTLPRFLELERAHGSVTRGLRAVEHGKRRAGFVALRDGMQTLVDRIAARIPTESIETGRPVREIRRVAGAWHVESDGRPPFEADVAILTCPAFVSSTLLSRHDPALSAALGELDYASCATVNLVYERKQIRSPLESYGFFAPRTAGMPILGCSFVSEKFEGRVPTDKVLLRAFLGGVRDPALLELDDDAVERRAHETLAPLLAIEGRPLTARVHRYPRSMPQLRVGHKARVAALESRIAEHPGLLLGGGALGSIGLPDCIAAGERSAERAWAIATTGAENLRLAI